MHTSEGLRSPVDAIGWTIVSGAFVVQGLSA